MQDAYDPAWSPDGGRLAFAKVETRAADRWNYLSKFQIEMRDATGTTVNRLTNQFDGDDRWPAWSPDGGRIAFSSNRDGNWEVHVMNADGANLVNLTKMPGNDRVLQWSR